MYLPTHFSQPDVAVLHAFMKQHSFALLCSVDEAGVPFASHLPLLFEPQDTGHGILVGHMAKANPQWRHADGRSVLAVFSGPHAFISPAWYESENVVPTWNYLAVHVTGTFRAIHDSSELLRIVSDMVDVYEGGPRRQDAARSAAWRLDPSSEYTQGMLKGIVGFRIEITRLEGKWKLNQNHPPERRAKVVRALREQGGADALAIADLMERMLP
jgi:transcriptional regulator